MTDQALRIGVCLSGGGFRASLFGLGVLRYLAEASLLGRTVAISAVSGGSITAAVTADRFPQLRHNDAGANFVADVYAPMVGAITRKNMRNRAIGRWALTRAWRFGSHGSALGATMAAHLLEARTITELPRDLQVLLTATDLATGLSFRVSQEFVGGYHFSYPAPPTNLRLGDVLAASTAVPFLFPPVQLDTRAFGLVGAPRSLSLVDGGVYDNSGLEWFQGWNARRPAAARKPNFLIVVDAGAQLGRRDTRVGWARSIRRSQAIQYRQTRATRTRWFIDQLLDDKVRGIMTPISSDARGFTPPPGATVPPGAADGALPVGFAEPLSRLRTDLDRFSSLEATLLAYHGYWSTHVRLATLHPDLAVPEPTWTEYAGLDDDDAARMKTELEAGEKTRPVRRR